MVDVLRVIDKIHELSPCPAVKYKIKRLLKQEVDGRLFNEFYNSKWVQQLISNQHEDGGYGRFHSQNSKVKQKYPTTERAVDCMKILGLERGNPLIDKLCGYMEGILRHEIEWPDGYEKNKWYRPAQPLFVASKLSVFGSASKELVEIFDCWHAILKEAFQNGEYNGEKANKISKELIGCPIDGSYIGLNSIILVEFFANMQEKISEEIKKFYLKWLHNNGKPIGYTSVILNRGLNNRFSELYRVYFPLSRFTCFKTEFEEQLCQLKEMRDPDGFWNFGRDFACQKLSDDWKSRTRMSIDHTVLALQLFV